MTLFPVAPRKNDEHLKHLEIPSVDQIIPGLIAMVDNATRSLDGPAFHLLEGTISPW
jgi:hypothetical protein